MSHFIEKAEQAQYPIVTTVGCVVFPGLVSDLDLKFKHCLDSCKRALEGDALVFVVSYKNPVLSPADMQLSTETLHSVGTLVRIERAITQPDGTPRVVVRGLCRGELLGLGGSEESGFFASVMCRTFAADPSAPSQRAYLKALLDSFHAYCQDLPQPIPEGLADAVASFRDPALLADVLIANLGYLPELKQYFLGVIKPQDRIVEVIAWMKSERARLKIDADIRAKVSRRLDEHQKEYRMREQIRVLRAELGEDEEGEDEEIAEYKQKIKDASLPDEIREKLLKEVAKLAKTPYASAESTVIRQYLDVCLEVPWTTRSEERQDVAFAAKLLEKDHSAMDKVKERILEFIAVRKRNPELKNQILCLIGAPGTGKTSVSASIAKALNRKFVRVCLGGVRDEAEIRGHRKTYIGAMPGRIITALRQAEVINPVILLDEIDKMSADAHGDPTAAMLEVLDAEQNCRFRDHFLELPVDLSDCIFIATANSRSSIPAPLIDRMEFIDLPPYLRSEKLRIAKEHLLPKQIARHGLAKKVLRVSDGALLRIIDEYTAEAGVRNLERQLATLCRKVAKTLVEEGEDRLIRVSEKNLPSWLGPNRITAETISKTNLIGVVNGLAWTEMGGTLLRVEAAALPGSGKLQLTGSLGEVMKESAQLAVSYVRAHAEALGVDPDFHKNLDIHIHLPEGAVPKDGPSAGVTLLTALVSELTGRAVRREVAMTGEISLHGEVLPIGGLREKATAAHRAGVKTVCIPKDNARELDELPAEIKENLTFLTAERAEQVLDAALLEKKG